MSIEPRNRFDSETGRAAGLASAASKSAEELAEKMRKAARARWGDRPLSPNQVERVSRAVLEAWLAIEGIDLALVSRADSPVDLIACAPSLEWIAPLQVKGVAAGNGFTVYRQYVGQEIVLVYVFLGRDLGGNPKRERTSMTVLTPEQAWSLPREMKMGWDEEFVTYRWRTVTAKLAQKLEPHTASNAAHLAKLIAAAATHWVAAPSNLPAEKPIGAD